MFWLGAIAAIMSALTFVADISFYMKGDIMAGRQAAIETILWFIAMCVCFK